MDSSSNQHSVKNSPILSVSPPAPPPPPPPPAASTVAARFGCHRCRLGATYQNQSIQRHDSSGASAGAGAGATHHTQRNVTEIQEAPKYSITSGYEGRNRLEEDDSACPALLERELHSLHRNVPALRRAGVDTNAIRQHFYPDGGWGWIVCGVAFLAYVLTTGFQLSFGLLLLYAMRHLGHEVTGKAGWLGAASWSVSMLVAPLVTIICRRKSTRLTAVIGGLVLSLGILFCSFATQLHQVAFSYGVVVGSGAAMVRESSAVMIGIYFKKRRQFVEMITMSGEGVGVALFSVILKEGVGKMGWRLGLQAVTGLVSISFFMGLLYRSASLYHPQRRAILHLKNQRKKVKEKKTHVRTPKPPFIDFTPLRSSTVRMLAISAAMAAFGVYAPIFFMSLHGYQDGYDMQDLVLLQTFVGLAMAVGVVGSGSVINRVCQISFRKLTISRQFICQSSVALIALSTLILSAASGYRTMCLLCWMYGLGLGSYRYSLKMFALERVRGKHFTKAWGFVKGAESIPVLLSVPFTAFLNESSHRFGRAGYYVCSAAAAISAILMFFVGKPDNRSNLHKYSGNGSINSNCTVALSSSDGPDLLNRSISSRYGHWFNSPYTSMTNGYNSTVGHHPYSTYSAGQPKDTNTIRSQCTAAGYGGSGGGRGPLHKSLSFAFQTAPPQWTWGANGEHVQQQYPQQHPQSYMSGYNAYTDTPILGLRDRCYSRQNINSKQNTLQQYPTRSRSVPELAHASSVCDCQLNYRQWHSKMYQPQMMNNNPVHVVEQITTSV